MEIADIISISPYLGMPHLCPYMEITDIFTPDAMATLEKIIAKKINTYLYIYISVGKEPLQQAPGVDLPSLLD